MVMSGRKVERGRQQNAAEFFTEHQQIAGFDNAGKSLFTTIRELVENHQITVPYVNTHDNLADFFTKPLPWRRFVELRNAIMNVPTGRSH